MAEQVKYLIGDREILFKEPTDGQVAAVAKFIGLIQKDIKTYGVSGISKILTVVDTMMVNEGDREYVEDLLIAGKLELEHLIGVLAVFVSQDQASATGPKRAQRGK